MVDVNLPGQSSSKTENILPMFNWNNQLKECFIDVLDGQYEGDSISFPVQECSINFSQDLVQHKHPNLPGAKIESMGSNPIIFKIKAPFLYGLQRGAGETWEDLFPQTFTKVFNILNDKIAPSLSFIHPILGVFTVKPQGGTTVTTPDIKNGQIIEFELIQSDVFVPVNDNSLQAAVSAANLFDIIKFELTPPLPKTITSINLSQLMGNINGLINSTTLEINQLTSSVNHAINQVKTIERSIDKLKTAATSGLSNQLTTVKAGLHSIGVPSYGLAGHSQNPFTAPIPTTSVLSKSSIAVFTVRIPMTLAAVAALVHNTTAQIINYNPGISKYPSIPVGIQIVYTKI